MELVVLLNELGFGLLAGELLGEISLGREVDDDLAGSVKYKAQLHDAFPEDAVVAREPSLADVQLRAP